MDRHKKAFFDRLDELDLLSDEAENQETEDFGRVLARSRKKERENDSFVTSSQTLTSDLKPKPSVSTNLIPPSPPPSLQSSVRTSASSGHERSDSASSGDRGAPAVRGPQADGPVLEKLKVKMPPTAGKRKRTYPVKVIPEHQQIFKGLHFCKLLVNSLSTR